MFVLQSGGWDWGGGGGVVVVGWGGGPAHSNQPREKTQRPDQRLLLLARYAGEVREGGELVLETAREGGTSPGLPCF